MPKTDFKVVLIGSSSFSAGVCEVLKENAAVIDSGDMPIEDISATYYSDCKEFDFSPKTESGKELKAELKKQNVIAKGVYPNIFKIAPIMSEWLLKVNSTHYFRSFVSEIEKRDFGYKIRISTVGGTKEITAEKIIDTTSDVLYPKFIDKDFSMETKNLLCAAIYSENGIETQENDKIKIFKTAKKEEGFLQFKTTQNDYILAHDELYKYWKSFRANCKISDIAPAIFKRVVLAEAFEKDGFYKLPSSNYGNVLSGFENGIKFIKKLEKMK